MTITRRDLVKAQIAIFDTYDRACVEEAPWSDNDFAHHKYYALANRAPWWRKLGVWSQAFREHYKQ